MYIKVLYHLLNMTYGSGLFGAIFFRCELDSVWLGFHCFEVGSLSVANRVWISDFSKECPKCFSRLKIYVD